MAPEQARGEAVDERADVYALGAMLYYLLAGTPPRSGTTVREVLAAAASERPRPVTEREPDTPPDLAAIVDKAMEHEAARRYPTARELAEDLRRFQTGQLVSAHRYSPGELVRRWVRQHRAAVTVAAVLGLALVTAVAGGFLAVRRQARIAEAERDRARVAAAEAEQVSTFLREMLGSADPRNSGKEVTVASVLDRAAERLERAARRPARGQGLPPADPGPDLPGPRAARPGGAPRPRRARGALKRHGADSADVARAREALASVLLDRGDLTAAEALYRQAIATCDRIGDADSDVALSARAELATTLQNLGRLDEAEVLHRDVLDRQRRRFGPDSAEVAASINNLGVVLGQRGDWKGAEALHREALEIIRRVKGPRNPDVASALTTVASAMESQGDLAGAESLYRESLGLRREPPGPGAPRHRPLRLRARVPPPLPGSGPGSRGPLPRGARAARAGPAGLPPDGGGGPAGPRPEPRRPGSGRRGRAALAREPGAAAPGAAGRPLADRLERGHPRGLPDEAGPVRRGRDPAVALAGAARRLDGRGSRADGRSAPEAGRALRGLGQALEGRPLPRQGGGRKRPEVRAGLSGLSP